MFEFLKMMGNYEERKVANTQVGVHDIDTAAVNDSSKPFETGICSPLYNDGKWVIVELYDTRELARAGRDRWCKAMEDPPAQLKDVSDCFFASMIDELGDGDWRGKERSTSSPENDDV